MPPTVEVAALILGTVFPPEPARVYVARICVCDYGLYYKSALAGVTGYYVAGYQ